MVKKYIPLRALLGAIALFASSSAAFAAVDDAVITITKRGTPQTESVKLEKIKKNVWRFQLPKEKLANADVLEVFFDAFSAKKGDTGYFVTGDSQMGTFVLDEGKVDVWGAMPIFGIQNPQGTFVAIVKGMRYEFSEFVTVNKGEYKVFPKFYIGSIPQGPYEDVVIDVYKLDGDDANYAGMARTYRKYQLENGVVRPLKERVKNNPVLAYTVDSIFVRIKNGIKDNKDKIARQTPENEPKLRVMHSFDECSAIMKGIKSLGVEKAEMCLVGWNAGGFDGRYPQLLPIPEEFGGEKKLRETIRTAKSLGYQITNHICNTDIYEISDDWDEKYVARRADGKMRHQLILAGGTAYYPCQKMHYETFVERDNKIILDLGFKGTQHNDVYSCIHPYPCFDKRHPCSRKETAEYMGLVAAASQKAHGGFGSEGPNDSFAGNLDFSLYVWAYPNHCGRKDPVLNKGPVPFWHIVYHGIILSNPYWDTIDPTYEGSSCGTQFSAFGVKWKKVLKMAELNGRPTFYFLSYKSAENQKLIAEAYKAYQPMKYLQYEFMDDHRELAPDVFLSVFSDGSEIVTNYSDSAFTYKDRTVESRNYKLFKPTFWRKCKNFFGIK